MLDTKNRINEQNRTDLLLLGGLSVLTTFSDVDGSLGASLSLRSVLGKLESLTIITQTANVVVNNNSSNTTKLIT